MDLVQYCLKTPAARLYLVASERGLRGAYLEEQDIPLVKSLRQSFNSHPRSAPFLAQAAIELKEYFLGKRKKFTVRFDFAGTAFQKKVWQELRRIPYGQTCSYKDIAIQINNEKACRAVGTANSKNPLCILIPCHRVIAADRSLGGYAGGIKMKAQLLRLEGAR
jgi:methylated-DNA-[protein]-cysteine S-methyltransferase